MGRILKWTAIVVAALAVVLYLAFKWAQSNTKQHSPEETISLQTEDFQVGVFYNRPYRKGREIFGGLVPYGEVWRTGANEATTFTTDQDLSLGNQTLPAGEYTLWTIPGAQQWIVLFNEQMYSWGVGFDGKPSRDPAFDKLRLEVPVEKLRQPVDQFTIQLNEKGQDSARMVMAWENTRLVIPFAPAKPAAE